MSDLTKSYSKILAVYADVIHFLGLGKKASLLLYQSRSWTVVGLRISNRLFSNQKHIPLYFRLIFPKSTAWFRIRIAVEEGNSEKLLKAVEQLMKIRNVYYEYSLIEFNLDYLLKTVEELNPYAFKLLYQRKINEFLKDSALYEIHNSFFLKYKPRINFHIDPKRFVFLLPVRYLFKTDVPKEKVPDYAHRFNLPAEIDKMNHTTHEVLVEGDKLWTLSDIRLLKGYQLINGDSYLCYEKSASPENKFIAGYFDASPSFRLLEESPYVKVNIRKYDFQDLDNIFLLSGRCTRNYFHWLIEYMPKLMWFARGAMNEYANFKLAVDENMPQQHYQALQYVMKKLSIPNQIIKINPDNHIYNIKKLIVCSNPTFIPDSFEEFSYADCSALNLDTLAGYRKILLSNVSNRHDRKIYIARHNFSSRKLVNESDVIDLFVKYGFEIVYPEQYTFEEQMNLFNSSKFIVGASGAAFSNLIFCQPGTVVINFLVDELKEFSLFSNLCALSQSQYYIEPGKLLRDKSHFSDKISWLYSDFKLDVESLEKKIQHLLPPA